MGEGKWSPKPAIPPKLLVRRVRSLEFARGRLAGKSGEANSRADAFLESPETHFPLFWRANIRIRHMRAPWRAKTRVLGRGRPTETLALSRTFSARTAAPSPFRRIEPWAIRLLPQWEIS